MSVPKYIVNLPELEKLIRGAMTGGQDITSKIQRSIGFVADSRPYQVDTLTWSPDEDIGIIGVRFGQEDIRNMGYMDNFDLVVEGDVVMEGIYHKELNEYKDFRTPYLIAEGSDVRLVNRNKTGIRKEVKFDIDYIEATLPQKEVIVTCVDMDTGEVIQKFTSFYKPIYEGTVNPPSITQYKTMSPPKDVYLGVYTVSPKIIEFLYEWIPPPPPPPPIPEPPIINPGDENPNVIVYPSDKIPVCDIVIEEDGGRDLVIEMEFASLSGEAFPDMNIEAPNGDTFGFRSKYLNVPGWKSISNSSASSRAEYTGYMEAPEIFTFKSPMKGTWKISAQNFGGDIPSLVRFDSNHPYIFTYREKTVEGWEDYRPDPF